MSISSYLVNIEKYAEKHYIKKFSKKYHSSWDITWRAVVEEFKRINSLFETSIAEIISDNGTVKIVKSDFRIAGGNGPSRRASGNRCIIAVHEDIKTVRILLVYHKNDIGDKNETAKWKEIIKKNYPCYCELLK